MDVDPTIRYSDERLCEIIAPRADLSASLTDTMREARRLYELTLGRVDGDSNA